MGGNAAERFLFFCFCQQVFCQLPVKVFINGGQRLLQLRSTHVHQVYPEAVLGKQVRNAIAHGACTHNRYTLNHTRKLRQRMYRKIGQGSILTFRLLGC